MRVFNRFGAASLCYFISNEYYGLGNKTCYGYSAKTSTGAGTNVMSRFGNRNDFYFSTVLLLQPHLEFAMHLLVFTV
jgi:hypothetical protein